MWFASAKPPYGTLDAAEWAPSTASKADIALFIRSPRRVLQGVSLWQCIFVDLAVFHDDLKVLGGIGDQVDIVQGITVNKQQIRKCAALHYAKLPLIRTTLARQRQQFGVGTSRHGECFGRGVPTDKRG